MSILNVSGSENCPNGVRWSEKANKVNGGGAEDEDVMGGGWRSLMIAAATFSLGLGFLNPLYPTPLINFP